MAAGPPLGGVEEMPMGPPPGEMEEVNADPWPSRGDSVRHTTHMTGREAGSVASTPGTSCCHCASRLFHVKQAAMEGRWPRQHAEKRGPPDERRRSFPTGRARLGIIVAGVPLNARRCPVAWATASRTYPQAARRPHTAVVTPRLQDLRFTHLAISDSAADCSAR
jgi:hypothetical protein